MNVAAVRYIEILVMLPKSYMNSRTSLINMRVQLDGREDLVISSQPELPHVKSATLPETFIQEGFNLQIVTPVFHRSIVSDFHEDRALFQSGTTFGDRIHVESEIRYQQAFNRGGICGNLAGRKDDKAP